MSGSFRMEIELAALPTPSIALPAVTLRAFEPGRDERAVYDAHQEIFAAGGVPPDPWDEWLQEAFREGFEPRFWLLAEVTGRIVGICLAYPGRGPDEGWVSIVGVRQPWRRRGIATAILAETFAALARAGRYRIALEVESENRPAIGLYERLGMRIASPA